MQSPVPSPKRTRTMRNVEAAALAVAYIFMLLTNYVVNNVALGFVAHTNTQIANTHPVYGLPIGWAFSVWGVIYLLEGLFVVYQALPRGIHEPAFEAIRLPVLALFAANAAWLFLFGNELYWTSQLVILLYDALLFVVLKRLDVNLFAKRGAGVKLAAAAFSANASWVTVASCLGLQVALLEAGWLPTADFTLTLLVLALAIAAAATFSRSDIVYAAVAAWALVGLIANQADGSEFGCNTLICPACNQAPLAICSRLDTSTSKDRPNGWASLECDSYDPSSTPRECLVPKSRVVVGFAYVGLALVAGALVVGLIRNVARCKASRANPLLVQPLAH